MKFLGFISQNLGTIAVLLVLAAIVALIVYFNVRSKKQGKSSCGNGCSCCPMAGQCHNVGKNDQPPSA